MRLLDKFRRAIPNRVEPLFSRVRFGQFVSVGIIGAVTDSTVLTVTTLQFGFPEIWAKAAGIEIAIIVMFFINEFWTFSDKGNAKIFCFIKRLGKSHLVRSGGITVQLVMYWILIQWVNLSVVISNTDIWFLVASLFSIGFAMFINYTFESIFTWQVHSSEPLNSK